MNNFGDSQIQGGNRAPATVKLQPSDLDNVNGLYQRCQGVNTPVTPLDTKNIPLVTQRADSGQ